MRFADMVLAQSTEDAEIVGREEELGALARFIHDIDRRPAGLVLEGEAGVGKTTLWRAAMRMAETKGHGIGGIIVSNVKRVAISNNKLIRTGNAIAVYTPASEVLVSGNQVEDSLFSGIRVDGNPFGCCSYPTGPTSIAVADNTVKRAGTAVPQDGILLNRTSHSTVVENRVEGSNRDGIDVRDSTEILVVDNQADSNARDGIRNRGTSAGNSFKDNRMHGNAEHDAHDENRTLNTWTDNICTTDFPAGTICRP